MRETTVNVDEKLAVDKCCPAGLYQRGPEGEAVFDCAGCLECGTCRILCGDTIIEKWEFPQAGMGVSYRFG